jgi:hypothetical protein
MLITAMCNMRLRTTDGREGEPFCPDEFHCAVLFRTFETQESVSEIATFLKVTQTKVANALKLTLSRLRDQQWRLWATVQKTEKVTVKSLIWDVGLRDTTLCSIINNDLPQTLGGLVDCIERRDEPFIPYDAYSILEGLEEIGYFTGSRKCKRPTMLSRLTRLIANDLTGFSSDRTKRVPTEANLEEAWRRMYDIKLYVPAPISSPYCFLMEGMTKKNSTRLMTN